MGDRGRVRDRGQLDTWAENLSAGRGGGVVCGGGGGCMEWGGGEGGGGARLSAVRI